MRRIGKLFIAVSLLATLLFPPLASAQSLIRDAEIEQTLRDYADPVFRAAGLTPSSVHIFIVNDSNINAFVAGGSNMFVHTGLIQASDNPDMLIGVMAHEAGHIAGGHLAQGAEKLENAQLGTLLSYVLGAAAAVGGGGDAAAAIMVGGQHLAQRNMLSYSRMNEQTADQAALTYLDKLGISAEGLLSLMEKLRTKENLYAGQVDPYALTHPLSRERIAHIRGHLLQTQGKDTNGEGKFKEEHGRMLAKLNGFINDPADTLRQLPKNDQSTDARYARAIAYHRQSKLTEALAENDALIAGAPNDPFFQELKGQILFEGGRVADALPYYRTAVKLLPASALLQSDLGRVLLAQQPAQPKEALTFLKRASELDNSNTMTWQQLGNAYAALNDPGQSALAYAEAALLKNEPEEALNHINQALDHLTASSPGRLRAEDLKAEATRLRREKREAEGPLG